jgi:ribosomal protein S18 acetylase RimI-like enzyme
MKRYWLLNDLYVNENYRGKGFSKQLIEASKELAKSTDAAGILLETGKSNDIGNKLYPSCGFEIYDEVNFYEWKISISVTVYEILIVTKILLITNYLLFIIYD